MPTSSNKNKDRVFACVWFSAVMGVVLSGNGWLPFLAALCTSVVLVDSAYEMSTQRMKYLQVFWLAALLASPWSTLPFCASALATWAFNYVN